MYKTDSYEGTSVILHKYILNIYNFFSRLKMSIIKDPEILIEESSFFVLFSL